MKKNFHCCATCIHFSVKKQLNKQAIRYCSRLGYETKPTYQFQCWEPKQAVAKLMKKDENH